MDAYSINELPGAVYLAHRDFQTQLLHELGQGVEVYDRLFKTSTSKESLWAQDIWHNPILINFTSISQAVNALKSLGKNWVNFPVAKFRRAALIQEKLPKFKVGRIPFPLEKSIPKFGCWALLDEKMIVASVKPVKNVPLGVYEFEENKITPPNRAYLKLWEVFTTLKRSPGSGERCLDLGSSPGGWTWVLQSLGASVLSVDKAELEKNIEKLPGVDFMKESAFSLEPNQVGAVDWLFSDIICYPERLFGLVSKWMASGLCRNFICTVKLQGETDFEWIEKFRSFSGSQLIHLYHNKHELTFVLLDSN